MAQTIYDFKENVDALNVVKNDDRIDVYIIGEDIYVIKIYYTLFKRLNNRCRLFDEGLRSFEPYNLINKNNLDVINNKNNEYISDLKKSEIKSMFEVSLDSYLLNNLIYLFNKNLKRLLITFLYYNNEIVNYAFENTVGKQNFEKEINFYLNANKNFFPKDFLFGMFLLTEQLRTFGDLYCFLYKSIKDSDNGIYSLMHGFLFINTIEFNFNIKKEELDGQMECSLLFEKIKYAYIVGVIIDDNPVEIEQNDYFYNNITKLLSFETFSKNMVLSNNKISLRGFLLFFYQTYKNKENATTSIFKYSFAVLSGDYNENHINTVMLINYIYGCKYFLKKNVIDTIIDMDDCYKVSLIYMKYIYHSIKYNNDYQQIKEDLKNTTIVLQKSL